MAARKFSQSGALPIRQIRNQPAAWQTRAMMYVRDTPVTRRCSASPAAASALPTAIRKTALRRSSGDQKSKRSPRKGTMPKFYIGPFESGRG